MTLIKTGCCGFPLPKISYARCFPVGEVQQTFYQPPMISTLERWRATVPLEFEFTLKAWQLITHTAKSPTFRRLKIKLSPAQLEQCGNFQATPTVKMAWETTLACALALKARYLLFQCPASFSPTPENIKRLRNFFAAIERTELKFLWEPRGNWDVGLIASLCRELDLIHAVDPFISPTVSTGLIYFRLHGGKNFAQVFTDAELQYLAGLIPPRTPAYVMFNNKSMLNDAERFQTLIHA